MTRLSVIRDLVVRHLEEASDSQGHYYDERRREVRLKGDMVMKRYHILSSAADYRAAKLAPRFDGPYVVSKVLSPVVYQLSDTTGSVVGSFHVSDLKQYYPEHQENMLLDDFSSLDESSREREGEGISPPVPCPLQGREVDLPSDVPRQEDRPRRGRPPRGVGRLGADGPPDPSPRRLRSTTITGRRGGEKVWKGPR